MNDLINEINKLDVKKIENLKLKYGFLKDILNNTQYLLSLLYIIDISTEYIKQEYNDYSPHWKSWAIITIKKLFEKNKINKKIDIIEFINKFFDYKKKEYDNYIDNIGSYSNEYFRDYYFIIKFIKKS